MLLNLLVEGVHISESTTNKNGCQDNKERVFVDLIAPPIEEVFEFFVYKPKDGLTLHFIKKWRFFIRFNSIFIRSYFN